MAHCQFIHTDKKTHGVHDTHVQAHTFEATPLKIYKNICTLTSQQSITFVEDKITRQKSLRARVEHERVFSFDTRACFCRVTPINSKFYKRGQESPVRIRTLLTSDDLSS